ncbi:hypothetical protein ACI2IP_10500 [Microbacterium sp. NPDC090218]
MTSTPSPAPALDGVEWGTVAEWATFGAATLALAISIGAIVIATRSERRLQFMRVHEIMTSIDTQRGRRLLGEKVKKPRHITWMKRVRPDDFDAVNRAVSLYHTLAIYARRHYLTRKVAVAHWGRTLARSWKSIEILILWRDEKYADGAGWGDLLWFAEQCGADVKKVRLMAERRQSLIDATNAASTGAQPLSSTRNPASSVAS